MKIIDHLKGNRAGVSCELFPPKQGTELANALEIVHTIAEQKPSFISVTYGAGGSNVGQAVAIATEVDRCGVPSMAHLTCINADEQRIETVLGQLKENHIDNVLALRGDLPAGETLKNATYRHASDLTKKIKSFGDFCVGGACYPEGHPESANRDADIENLKHKVEAGVDFLTTQLFFDNDMLYSFLYRLQSAGIHVPVLAGIMPITNASQVSRMVDLSNAYIPRKLMAICDRFRNNPEAMKQAGIAYATDQIIDLISNGVRGIHIYTMNKPEIAKAIISNVNEIIRATNS